MGAGTAQCDTFQTGEQAGPGRRTPRAEHPFGGQGAGVMEGRVLTLSAEEGLGLLQVNVRGKKGGRRTRAVGVYGTLRSPSALWAACPIAGLEGVRRGRGWP